MGYFGWNNGGLRTNLIDSKFDNVNGFDYASHKNEFGASSACYPISESGTNRFTEGWTISPLNGVVNHGCSPFDNFGSSGVPARPDSNTGYAMGVWAANGNLAYPTLRLEHGIDIATLRQWYALGKKTWTLGFWFAALPGVAAIMAQNLTNPVTIDQAFVNWEPTTPPCPKNKVNYQVVDCLGAGIIPLAMMTNYTVASAWNYITASFTLTTAHEKYFRQQGYPCWQLQIQFGNEGHPRLLIYNPTLT